jgi:capsular polysaccharide biosynthesis protein
MVNYQIGEEIDIAQFLKHYYKKRGLVFRVLILSIVLSIIYSVAMNYLSPPIYKYTSQSVIDMTVSEEAEYQKAMFISYLGSQKIFDESAKSIGLSASYAYWREFIVIENIRDTNQVVLKISGTKTNKLNELNRRIVSNTIFQSSEILTGIAVQTLEEAEILDEVQITRKKVSFTSNLFMFITFGFLGIFIGLTAQMIYDRRIKHSNEIERFTGLTVLGTIPDFEKLSISEKVNLKNFIRGLIWIKRK